MMNYSIFLLIGVSFFGLGLVFGGCDYCYYDIIIENLRIKKAR